MMKRIFLTFLFLAGSLWGIGVAQEVFAQERGSLPPGVEEAQDRVKKWTSATKVQQAKNEAIIKKQKADLAKRQGLEVKKQELVVAVVKEEAVDETKETAEGAVADQEKSQGQKVDQKKEQKTDKAGSESGK